MRFDIEGSLRSVEVVKVLPFFEQAVGRRVELTVDEPWGDEPRRSKSR